MTDVIHRMAIALFLTGGIGLTLAFYGPDLACWFKRLVTRKPDLPPVTHVFKVYQKYPMSCRSGILETLVYRMALEPHDVERIARDLKAKHYDETFVMHYDYTFDPVIVGTY